MKCPECEGTGKRLEGKLDDYNIVECIECDGTGEIDEATPSAETSGAKS